MTAPLSLYVHLPWCVQKCPYCDFNSHTAGSAADRSRYLNALERDFRVEAERAAGRCVQTVFFGGGTPSYFSAAEIGRILEAANVAFDLAADAEITMEANPGTVERDSLADYRRAGVNRLSLGAQSFHGASLRRLGRIHGPQEIFDAWRDACAAGFTSVNLDLMYALPGQTLDMAVADIEQALALSPPHLSWYQLTLEPNTVFHARPPADLPDAELAFAIEERCRSLLRSAGYEHYEISAFAMPGHRCRHNLNYWRFGDYLAAGAGAHGKLTDDDGRVWRYRKPAHPASYMSASEAGAFAPPFRVRPADLAFEYMLNRLRLAEGFTPGDFTASTGLPWQAVDDGMKRADALGLLACHNGRWRTTRRGRRFLNDLQALFLPEEPGSGMQAPVKGACSDSRTALR